LKTSLINHVFHIFWGLICVALVVIASGLWATNVKISQENDKLEKQLTALQKPECVARDTWQPGTTKSFTVESDNLDREYLVHLPKDFKADKTYPAVIYFSGKGKGAVDSDSYSGYSQLPAITIYPEPTIGKDGAQSWQGAPYSSGINDVKFVSHMLDQINGQLCIERSHVYAAGVSNGGSIVAVLSCQMSDRIAAFGTVAGAYYPESDCISQKPAPIITIHGDGDLTVPYLGSVVRHLPNIDDWSAHRAHDNGCKPRPFVSHQQASTMTEWLSCTNNASVRSVLLHGVGHAWTPADRDMIWQFFSAY
jgi:polyhydroxybutyrate depolymerase